MQREEGKILDFPTITAQQIATSLLAIPAFLPATLCTGYLTAWFINLHGFRQRSVVERVFWSVPLSLAVSTIGSILIGRFLSLAAVVVFLLSCAALWLAIVGKEWLSLRRAGAQWNIGWRPLGGAALTVAIVWIFIVVLSLIDLQSNHRLFMSVAVWDQSFRVNWTDAVLRTGVPPANSLYFFRHPAVMRNYYFWYVVCAAVAKMAHLPSRAVFISSCVWSGFALAALAGLFLKHFLAVGERLRRQFLLCVSLLAVTGLDVCVNLWNLVFFHMALPADLEWWSKDPIDSWYDSLLWAPHHVASLVCCMLAFLLAWMAGKEGARGRTVSVALIAASLASAFGLSIYVTFAFFLVMLVWALWQAAIVRSLRPALLFAAGGVCALLLLVPYLRELTHSSTGKQEGGMFGFVVRQMIPPDGLLSSRLIQHFATGHPMAARNFANFLLLTPGYFLELGLYFVVFLIYLVPAWRGRTLLTPAQRSLVCIAAATFPFISLMRSLTLKYDDFGIRGVLVLQFPLLLLASEVIIGWNFEDRKLGGSAMAAGLPRNIPRLLRSVASITLAIGVLSALCQSLMLRFVIPLAESNMGASRDPDAGSLSHNAYISSIGYAQLDASIPREAIVQFNPAPPNLFWMDVDLFGVDRQTGMITDRDGCGSPAGGDPSGCPAMAAAVDSLFNSASADQARATCREFGIQYLVARVYDPAWKDKTSWVWTLSPVVSDDEFRALDCRQ
jgi:hypothetical protein